MVQALHSLAAVAPNAQFHTCMHAYKRAYRPRLLPLGDCCAERRDSTWARRRHRCLMRPVLRGVAATWPHRRHRCQWQLLLLLLLLRLDSNVLLQQLLQLLGRGANHLVDLLAVLVDMEGGHGCDARGLGHVLQQQQQQPSSSRATKQAPCEIDRQLCVLLGFLPTQGSMQRVHDSWRCSPLSHGGLKPPVPAPQGGCCLQ